MWERWHLSKGKPASPTMDIRASWEGCAGRGAHIGGGEDSRDVAESPATSPDLLKGPGSQGAGLPPPHPHPFSLGPAAS